MPSSDEISNNIFVAVREILKASSLYTGATAYVKNVFDGVRDNVPENGFPCIVLEPGSQLEKMATADSSRKKFFEFQLHIGCYMESVNYDAQIIGDHTLGPTIPGYVGIMDFVNDVKNAIDTYPQLNYDGTGSRCNWFLFPQVTFDVERFPFRKADITLQATLLTAGSARR